MSPYIQSNNFYDPHGALQGVMEALRIHASAITLDERLRIAMELMKALEDSFNAPERPTEETLRLSAREQYELRKQNRPKVEPRVVPRRDPSMSEYSQYYD